MGLYPVSRGGKREGSGAPPLPPGKKKKAVLVTLPPDLVDWMDRQPESRGVLIEMAVREKYGVVSEI